AAHSARASLWELCFSRQNLAQALRRVEQNAGAPGIDGMGTKELRPWLRRHWPQVRSQLDAGGSGRRSGSGQGRFPGRHELKVRRDRPIWSGSYARAGYLNRGCQIAVAAA
ncbi:MAG: hypothetical protein LC790_10440, partial [Actinobacteria bacterium]|nr:hypothetical protein [Actinomycetota bacterium]